MFYVHSRFSRSIHRNEQLLPTLIGFIVCAWKVVSDVSIDQDARAQAPVQVADTVEMAYNNLRVALDYSARVDTLV